jgi:hypothetical protein
MQRIIIFTEIQTHDHCNLDTFSVEKQYFTKSHPFNLQEAFI